MMFYIDLLQSVVLSEVVRDSSCLAVFLKASSTQKRSHLKTRIFSDVFAQHLHWNAHERTEKPRVTFEMVLKEESFDNR